MYTYVFWIGTIVFLVTSFLLAQRSQNTVFYLQVAGGVAIFVGSKIGREFLGLA